MNIFELMHEKYVFPNSVKLFESFAGIGCQRMAFDRLGINYESVGISEIDQYAIKSYMSIHGETRNFGDITKIKGSELPQIDVFTYSFPCTDLSKAGKQKGLNSTRSGLVYEVLRILHECNECGNLPRVLIMENVVDLVQAKFIRDFNEIQVELESMGYSNYTEVLNGKDYGVAQNRERVFMVSILGDYYYEFPKPIKLEKRLKDYLEESVDDKYYLTNGFINAMNKDSGKFNRAERFEQSTHKDIENELAFTITSRAGGRPTDNFIQEPIAGQYQPKDRDYNKNGKKREEQLEIRSDDVSNAILTGDKKNMIIEPICLNSIVNGKQPSLQNRIYDSEGISTAVTTGFLPSITVKEATEKGYAEAYVGDCINMAQPKSTTRRGRVGQQIAQTITTQNELGVVTSEPSGLYLGTSEKFAREPLKGIARCLKAQTHDSGVINGLRIRKLTPLECWRLMGINDSDFHKAKLVCSNSQLYKQAGNGIVVDVFAAILRQMKGDINAE